MDPNNLTPEQPATEVAPQPVVENNAPANDPATAPQPVETAPPGVTAAIERATNAEQIELLRRQVAALEAKIDDMQDYCDTIDARQKADAVAIGDMSKRNDWLDVVLNKFFRNEEPGGGG